MEESNDYAAQMEKRQADFPDKEEIANHLLTIQQLWVELEAARVKGQQYSGEVEDLTRKLNLAELEKLCKKKEETAAEIILQEVRARIEALSEYKEGGFEIDEELESLRHKEIECEVDYSTAAVSEHSIGRINLPQISDDSIS
ncbi:hypothetical protein Bca101_082889 [Brassica carinata]